MSTALLDVGIEKDVEDDTHLGNPIPCIDLSIEGDCNNAAVYMCRPRCCHQQIPLCEDCFFTFVNWAIRSHDRNPQAGLVCNYCHKGTRLDSKFLIILWRI